MSPAQYSPTDHASSSWYRTNKYCASIHRPDPPGASIHVLVAAAPLSLSNANVCNTNDTTQIITRARISHHTSASARPHMLSQTESACSKCASRYNTHACIYIPPHHSDTRPLLIHLSIHPLLNAHHNTHRTNESICSHAHAHPPTHIYPYRPRMN